MRLAAVTVLCAAAACAASPQKPRVTPALVTAMAERLDRRLAGLMPDDPVMPVGLTQGAYIPGIGAVFMGSVNLAPMAGITPFHQTISKQEIARIHRKKAERIPKLKEMMRQTLVDLASSMDPVPADEQVVMAITLFYFTGEDTLALPSQIVARGQRKALLDQKGAAVKVDEF